jgi:hypothetical protein
MRPYSILLLISAMRVIELAYMEDNEGVTNTGSEQTTPSPEETKSSENPRATLIQDLIRLNSERAKVTRGDGTEAERMPGGVGTVIKTADGEVGFMMHPVYSGLPSEKFYPLKNDGTRRVVGYHAIISVVTPSHTGQILIYNKEGTKKGHDWDNDPDLDPERILARISGGYADQNGYSPVPAYNASELEEIKVTTYERPDITDPYLRDNRLTIQVGDHLLDITNEGAKYRDMVGSPNERVRWKYVEPEEIRGLIPNVIRQNINATDFYPAYKPDEKKSA